jgi:hypothetical protein
VSPPRDGPAAAGDTHALFINYRREDSGGQARALLYALEASFPGRVFMDVKTLSPGVNYVEEIERTGARCRAVLVLIGKRWATITDAAGRRRLEDPRDLVVLEVAAALRRHNILVVPVLVADAALPAQSELPEPLRPLLGRHCLHLTDQDWEYDADKLVETLRNALGAGKEDGARRRALRSASPPSRWRASSRRSWASSASPARARQRRAALQRKVSVPAPATPHASSRATLRRFASRPSVPSRVQRRVGVSMAEARSGLDPVWWTPRERRIRSRMNQRWKPPKADIAAAT